MVRWFTIFGMLAVLALGCNKDPGETDVEVESVDGETTASTKKLPAFSLETSEYPSWSTFIVAAKAGLVNPKEGGEHGKLEQKWKVDLIVNVKDYDSCLLTYGNEKTDAVCITNIDALNPALSVQSTAICPTSTSAGADKIITAGITNLQDLKSVTVYGLQKTVSEYCWVGGLEQKGENPAEYKYENLDPAAAATALQTGTGETRAISVWNPFALQTLRTAQNAQVVFTSELLPEEIIDMVLVRNKSLEKEGGENFACLVCDTYYEVCKRLDSSDQKIADATLTALGEDFSKLPLEDMRIVVQETKFYSTPQAGQDVFGNPEWQKKMNEVVLPRCERIGIVEDKKPTLGYDDPSADLNFSTKYMKKVAGN